MSSARSLQTLQVGPAVGSSVRSGHAITAAAVELWLRPRLRAVRRTGREGPQRARLPWSPAGIRASGWRPPVRWPRPAPSWSCRPVAPTMPERCSPSRRGRRRRCRRPGDRRRRAGDRRRTRPRRPRERRVVRQPSARYRGVARHRDRQRSDHGVSGDEDRPRLGGPVRHQPPRSLRTGQPALAGDRRRRWWTRRVGVVDGPQAVADPLGRSAVRDRVRQVGRLRPGQDGQRPVRRPPRHARRSRMACGRSPCTPAAS